MSQLLLRLNMSFCDHATPKPPVGNEATAGEAQGSEAVLTRISPRFDKGTAFTSKTLAFTSTLGTMTSVRRLDTVIMPLGLCGTTARSCSEIQTTTKPPSASAATAGVR